jgi:hypothetical protein
LGGGRKERVADERGGQNPNRGVTPMQRWEMENQRDAPYNAVARYEANARAGSQARLGDEGIENDQSSTAATFGDAEDRRF